MPETPDGIILCGGAGLRLRSVIGPTPKPLADVAGRPFLEILLRQLRRHGIQRVILAVGYQKEVIHSHFQDQAFGLELVYSVETQPLGTGGALRNALGRVQSDSVIVLNGDSYTDANLAAFVTAHRQSNAEISVVVVPPDGRGDCGSVKLAGDGAVLSFREKPGHLDVVYINAGIYMMSCQLLHEIPAGNSSLEQELMPRWVEEGRRIQGIIHSGPCLDIGTPERYRTAQGLLAESEVEANGVHSVAQL